MRATASVSSVSWIPSEAVTGPFQVPFSMGVAKYDEPRPDLLEDPGALVRDNGARFANVLTAWSTWSTENPRLSHCR